MNDYYKELDHIVVYHCGGNNEIEEFKYAEWQTSGDFMIVFQEEIKTVLPLKEIKCFKIIKNNDCKCK